MVSMLDFGSGGPVSNDGWGTALRCAFGQVTFALTVPLFTQEYKFVPEDLVLGVTIRRGDENTRSRFMLRKTGRSSSLMSHQAHIQTLPLPTFLPVSW